MDIKEPPRQILEEISQILERPGFTVSGMLRTFFEGTGAPIPSMFDEVKGTFDEIVDLSEINLLSFRSRAFAWASTGSPCIGSQGEKIEVSRAPIIQPFLSCLLFFFSTVESCFK